MVKNHRRIPELDSLRGIAAVAVLLFHFSIAFKSQILPESVFDYGVTGVDLFFMISGFVIFMSITASASMIDFWFARIKRLFPAYWISILITLFIVSNASLVAFSHDWRFISGNLLMIQPVFFTTNLVDAYWTLYVELTFYVVITLICLTKLTNKIETVIWFALILMIGINGFYQLHLGQEPYQRLFIAGRFLLPLICYFHFFASGIIYYVIYKNGFNANRVALLIVCFATTILIHSTSGRMNLFFDTGTRMYCEVVFNIFFLLIVLRKVHFFKNKVFYFLGRISYPLYLIHESIGTHTTILIKGKIGLDGAILSGVAVSIIIAIIITYWMEPFIQKWLQLKYHNNKLSKCRNNSQ